MNKQNTIGDRLQDWISSKKLSASDFARQLNIQRSALSHIFSGRNKPSVDVLLKIKAAYPDINLDWLITGEINVKNNDESAKLEEIDEDFDNSHVTDVNILNLNDDNQDVSIHRKTDIKSQDKDRNLVRIIELYSDGSFRHFDP